MLGPQRLHSSAGVFLLVRESRQSKKITPQERHRVGEGPCPTGRGQGCRRSQAGVALVLGSKANDQTAWVQVLPPSLTGCGS